MLYKCRGKRCGKLFWQSLVTFGRCKICDFTTARCDECGGAAGVLRSVVAHIRWYNSIGIKRGMPDYHMPDSEALKEKAPKRSLRAVS